MAVTFSADFVSDTQLQHWGESGVALVKITCAGTTSDNGDVLNPSEFKIGYIGLVVPTMAVDSAVNPENAFIPGMVMDANSNQRIVFFTAGGAPGAGVPLTAVTDGTDVTGYSFYAIVIGLKW